MKNTLYSKYIKRLLDIVLSASALIILALPMAALALLIKQKLGSPVIFSQERPGRIDSRSDKEKIFRLYKFRSMTDERDPSTGELLSDEERLTPFGKKLRSTSLDELPELWNILKGDMSIIGPRPLLLRYLPLYSPVQRSRHYVRPGLTGWAQVNGRNAISWEQKFACDVEYVKNISFALDCKIFFKTIGIVLRREGISQDGEATMEEFKGTQGSKSSS